MQSLFGPKQGAPRVIATAEPQPRPPVPIDNPKDTESSLKHDSIISVNKDAALVLSRQFNPETTFRIGIPELALWRLDGDKPPEILMQHGEGPAGCEIDGELQEVTVSEHIGYMMGIAGVWNVEIDKTSLTGIHISCADSATLKHSHIGVTGTTPTLGTLGNLGADKTDGLIVIYRVTRLYLEGMHFQLRPEGFLVGEMVGAIDMGVGTVWVPSNDGKGVMLGSDYTFPEGDRKIDLIVQGDPKAVLPPPNNLEPKQDSGVHHFKIYALDLEGDEAACNALEAMYHVEVVGAEATDAEIIVDSGESESFWVKWFGWMHLSVFWIIVVLIVIFVIILILLFVLIKFFCLCCTGSKAHRSRHHNRGEQRNDLYYKAPANFESPH